MLDCLVHVISMPKKGPYLGHVWYHRRGEVFAQQWTTLYTNVVGIKLLVPNVCGRLRTMYCTKLKLKMNCERQFIEIKLALFKCHFYTEILSLPNGKDSTIPILYNVHSRFSPKCI